MVALFIALALLNLIGIVACHQLARSRGSRSVVFWTTMGVLFGPLAIPFAARVTRRH